MTERKRDLLRPTIRRMLSQLVLVLGACSPQSCPDNQVTIPTIFDTGESDLTSSPQTLRVPLGGTGAVTLTATASITVSKPLAVVPGILVTLPTQVLAMGATTSAIVTVDGSATIGGIDMFPIATGTSSGLAVNHYGTLIMRLEVIEPFSIATAVAVSGRAGQVISRQVIVDKTSGFTAPLSLSFTGLPPGATAVFGAVPPEQTSSVPYTVTTLSTTVADTYNVRIVATGNGITRSAPVALTIEPPLASPDFSLQLLTSTLTVAASGTYTVDMSLPRNASVTDNIELSISGLPSGVTASFAPASVSGTTARLTLVSTNAAAIAQKSVIITGVASGLTRTATLLLTVLPPPNFALSATPSLVILHGVVTPAVPVTTRLSIARTGMVGDIILDAVGLPQGVSVVFSPGTVRDTTSTLSFSSNGTAAPATYSVTIRGSSAGLLRSTIVELKMESADGDFTAEFRPPTATFQQGETGTLSLSLSRTGALVDAPITLTAVTGPPALQMIPLPPTVSGVAFVSFIVSSTIPAGSYPLTVNATGGFLTRQTTATINVIPRTPDFSLSPTPSQFELPRAEFTPFLIVVTARGGFTGPIQFSAVNPLPGNMNIEFVTNPTSAGFVTVRLYASPNVTPDTYVIRFTGTSGNLVRTVDVRVIVKP